MLLPRQPRLGCFAMERTLWGQVVSENKKANVGNIWTSGARHIQREVGKRGAQLGMAPKSVGVSTGFTSSVQLLPKSHHSKRRSVYDIMTERVLLTIFLPGPSCSTAGTPSCGCA